MNALNVSSPTTLTATITLDTNAVVGTQILTVATNGRAIVRLLSSAAGRSANAEPDLASKCGGRNDIDINVEGDKSRAVRGAGNDTGPGVTLGPVNVDGTSTMTTPVTIDPSATRGSSQCNGDNAGRYVAITNIYTRYGPRRRSPVLGSVSQDTVVTGTTVNLTTARS